MEVEEDAGNERVATYKVGMLGASEVGKTALTAQFTTSDYICAYDASLGKRFGAFRARVFSDQAFARALGRADVIIYRRPRRRRNVGESEKLIRERDERDVRGTRSASRNRRTGRHAPTGARSVARDFNIATETAITLLLSAGGNGVVVVL